MKQVVSMDADSENDSREFEQAWSDTRSASSSAGLAGRDATGSVDDGARENAGAGSGGNTISKRMSGEVIDVEDAWRPGGNLDPDNTELPSVDADTFADRCVVTTGTSLACCLPRVETICLWP